MLIQGGTIKSGRRWTVGVAGAYWMSSIRSFLKITLPGVAATVSPTVNPFRSVIRMRSSPLPRSMSSRRLASPLIRFSPPLSSVALSTAGFHATLLLGDIASRNCRV